MTEMLVSQTPMGMSGETDTCLLPYIQCSHAKLDGSILFCAPKIPVSHEAGNSMRPFVFMFD